MNDVIDFNDLDSTSNDTVEFDVNAEINLEELDSTMDSNNSKWDGRFDGSYDLSRYNDGSLENDIVNAGLGIYANSMDGLVKESSNRIDVWGVGDSDGHYDHWYFNNETNEFGKAPDGRHNN